MNKVESDRFNEWRWNHKCDNKDNDRFSVTFTATGFSDVVTAKCKCGEKKDISDIDCW